MTLVVDASVAIKWFVPEVLAENAARLLDGRHRLAAPDFLLVEVANIIWKKARLGEILPGDGDAALAELNDGPIEFVETRPLLGPALRLARELDHPVDDCIYLAAAGLLSAVAITANRRFFDRTRGATVADRLQWLGFASG